MMCGGMMLLLIPGAISNSNAVIRQEFRKLRFQMIDDKLPQREFALRISIAEAPLESEKTLEFARQRTVELGCHRGTGKATWRNRRRATRTYTEVEEGRRWPKMSPTTFGLTPASICRVA